MIRKGTPADLPDITRMALAFLDATQYGRLFRATGESLAVLAGIIFSFGDNAAILLDVDDTGETVGMLVIVASPHPFNQKLYADEVVWWVDPSSRGSMRRGPALLRAAEEWARERKCYMVKMVAPAGSTVGLFYEKLGYAAIETAYAKEL